MKNKNLIGLSVSMALILTACDGGVAVTVTETSNAPVDNGSSNPAAPIATPTPTPTATATPTSTPTPSPSPSASPAALAPDVASYNFGSIAVNSSADRSFTITNSGQQQASALSISGLSAPFSFKGGSFPGVGGNCAAALAAGANCSVVLSYSPSSSGSSNNSLSVSYNDGVQVQGAALSLSGGGTQNVVQIAAGGVTTCVRYDSGNLKCWGPNNGGVAGSVGDGTMGTVRSSPTSVIGINNAVDVSVDRAGAVSCAIIGAARNVKCWGRIYQGVLPVVGTGTPVLIETAPGVALAGVQEVHSNCALLTNGSVYCWGLQSLLTADSQYASPTLFNGSTGLLKVSSLAISADFGCAVVNASNTAPYGGSMKCWGNTSGRIAGTSSDAGVTISVGAATNYLGVTAGADFVCAMQAGAVICIGADTYGTLGNNASLTNSTTPVAVSGTPVNGYYDTMANYDTISWTNSYLASSYGVTDISLTASGHTCMVVQGGSVLCWGNNGYGQLGDNSTTNRATPVAPAVSNVSAVAVGAVHSCVLRNDHQVQCWGSNYWGQIGDGTQTDRSNPTLISL